MTGKDTGLETLHVWQKAISFAVDICQDVLPSLPKEEKWALSSQLRRAAQSIPANIAEGYGRFYYQEAIRFCYIARGSLEETFSHLTLANKLNYINDDRYNKLTKEIEELGKMTNGYIGFLKRSKRGQNEPGATKNIRDETAQYHGDYDFESLEYTPDT